MTERKYQKEYDAYTADRKGYNFTALDYITWLSWHLNISLPKLREKIANDNQFEY